MGLFSIEHSRFAYRADFAFYGTAVLSLAAFLGVDGRREQWPSITTLVLLGGAGWTLIEYLLHRFVLHGVQPFRGWHAQHHRQPGERLGAPTVLSAALIFAFVFLPALALGTLCQACALTLGVLAGYLAYGITHHATHHWRSNSAWLKRRKRWHALHHHHAAQPDCYGVTSPLWDHVFGSAGQHTPTSAAGAIRKRLSWPAAQRQEP